jgi:aryl-alcohol dehydrogenase-like predicted oxidoreductase
MRVVREGGASYRNSFSEAGLRGVREARRAGAVPSRRARARSLSRLGLDAIDLYQIHWPIPDREIEEGWSPLVG